MRLVSCPGFVRTGPSPETNATSLATGGLLLASAVSEVRQACRNAVVSKFIASPDPCGLISESLSLVFSNHAYYVGKCQLMAEADTSGILSQASKLSQV